MSLKDFTIDSLVSTMGHPYNPNFGDMTTYPQTLVVGDAVFPMLYLYYYGEPSRVKKVTDEALFKQGLEESLQKQLAINSRNNTGTAGQDSDYSQTKATFDLNLRKFYRMFTSSCRKNTEFVYMLTQKCQTLMANYRSRLPQTRPNHTKGQNYYNDGRGQYDYYPILKSGDPNALDNAMETLRILVENRVIGTDFDLGIRPINLYDGSFAKEQESFVQAQKVARILGLPASGVFTINRVPRHTMMYHTFTGIDINAVASLNDRVTKIDGLTSLSWSIHRGKQTQRLLGSESPAGRSGGSRTIAGTMIFALSDHHPLLDIIPDDYEVMQNTTFGENPEFWRPFMLADQIPPFDIVLTMQNEYGFASGTVLYGVEISDEGCVMGIDNLVVELVLQYTAVAMDPICQAKPDENGNIDVFGILSRSTSSFWRRREQIIAGAGYSDLQEAFEAQYDTLVNVVSQRRKNYIKNKGETMYRRNMEPLTNMDEAEARERTS